MTFISTIIPTIARPTLAKAVNSVLHQDFVEAEFEVIVVNDSGEPLPEEDWQCSPHVHIICTQQRERIFARNTGAAIARGQYFHFLDDDDWVDPAAFRAFWQMTQHHPEAGWLYGACMLTNTDTDQSGVIFSGTQGYGFVQALAGDYLPMSASIIRSEAFYAVGGFRPEVVYSQDRDLHIRIAYAGEIAATPQILSFQIRDSLISKTDYSLVPYYSRRAREKVIDQPGVFGKLLRSADSSYWYGRIVRLYLTSSLWNLRHRKLAKAFSRGWYAVLGGIVSLPYIFSKSFWRAVFYAHKTPAYSEAEFISQIANVA